MPPAGAWIPVSTPADLRFLPCGLESGSWTEGQAQPAGARVLGGGVNYWEAGAPGRNYVIEKP